MSWYEKASQEAFLKSAARFPRAHYSLHVEAVRISKTGHLCGGYSALHALQSQGRIRVLETGLVEIVP